MPTAAETEAVGREVVAAATGSQQRPTEDEASDIPTSVDDFHEVSLGSYHVSAYQPSSNTTLRIDLDLFATVLAADEGEFHRLFATNEHRLREQVIVTLRGAEVTDLTDAGLGLIKRQILEKSNRILGKPLLRQIVFSEFSFMER
jgi:flagellar FliL protein